LLREEGLQKVDGLAVTRRGGTQVERFALAGEIFPTRPVERTGAGFTRSKTSKGGAAAMNAGKKETEGYSRPAVRCCHSGFAGGFTQSQNRQPDRLSRDRSDWEMLRHAS
jgi:hypothetical protein